MSEEPDFPTGEDSDFPDPAELRRRIESDRAESRRRYRDHLTAVFIERGCEDAAGLADAALDALTVWRRLGTEEPCRCGCHPSLPSSDLHDFGFDCPCTRTPEQRRLAFEDFRRAQREFWSSPRGRSIVAAEEAEEDALEQWLAGQPGVVVTEHGGMCPEQWSGTVDGHSFYFRERHGDWRIELDLKPSGRFVNTVVGIGGGGRVRTEPREIDEGDLIATGTVDAEGYGHTPLERAQFLLRLIRTHLTRRECRWHGNDLAAVEELLGVPVRWCPVCGAELCGSAGG